MHYDIECYYNDMDIEVEEDCVEWQYFEKFEEEWGQRMKPLANRMDDLGRQT